MQWDPSRADRRGLPHAALARARGPLRRDSASRRRAPAAEELFARAATLLDGGGLTMPSDDRALTDEVDRALARAGARSRLRRPGARAPAARHDLRRPPRRQRRATRTSSRVRGSRRSACAVALTACALRKVIGAVRARAGVPRRDRRERCRARARCNRSRLHRLPRHPRPLRRVRHARDAASSRCRAGRPAVRDTTTRRPRPSSRRRSTSGWRASTASSRCSSSRACSTR